MTGDLTGWLFQYVGRPAQELVAAATVWQYATVTTFAVIIIAERVG